MVVFSISFSVLSISLKYIYPGSDIHTYIYIYIYIYIDIYISLELPKMETNKNNYVIQHLPALYSTSS